MNNPLENSPIQKYLWRLERELSPLSADERAGEIAEIRGHLQAATTRFRDEGMSEIEAQNAAIAAFGEAKTVGKWLRAAHEKPESWWRVVLALAVCVAWFAGSDWIWPQFYEFKEQWVMSWLALPADFLVVGLMIGAITPGRARLILLAFGVVGCGVAAFFARFITDGLAQAAPQHFAGKETQMLLMCLLIGLLFNGFYSATTFAGVLVGRKIARWRLFGRA